MIRIRPDPAPAASVQILVKRLPMARATLIRTIKAAVAAAAGVLGHAEPEVSVVVVGDQRMRRLNREFHAADETTDVLAFPLEDAHGGAFGEIVVCAPEAVRQARYRGLDPAVELVLYVVHGVLHLLGEDDHRPAEARRMRRLERTAMATLGMSLPEAHLDELK